METNNLRKKALDALLSYKGTIYIYTVDYIYISHAHMTMERNVYHKQNQLEMDSNGQF